MTETHIIKLPKRTGTMKLTEEPTRILIELTFDKYGFFEDEPELGKWLEPIYSKYDADPRPFVMKNPATGEVTTVFGDSNSAYLFIQ